jgi:RNA polymerase sigma factor (sigma-70 family)
MVVDSEEDLVFHIRSKKESAFRYLYDTYAPALYNVIQKSIKCHKSSKDLLQNVFVKIWSDSDKYEPSKGRLFTWMLQITRNETLDHLRSKQGHDQVVAAPKQKKAPANDSKLINRLDIQKQMQHLPLKERALLELYSTGLSCTQIGQLLHIPEGTVKPRMRIAYKKLKGVLQA